MHGRRLHRRRRHERGSALVLAVLILFAMLGLGMLAMRSSTQNIAGSGNLRMNKQARYVAEQALHHAVTLMNARGTDLLRLRGLRTDAHLELDSSGNVRAVSPDGAIIAEQNFGVPDLLYAGPAALGQFARAGLGPSYRVRMDGFTPTSNVVASSVADMAASGEDPCLVHFTADGFIAPANDNNAPPSEAQLNSASGAELYAEHRLSAALVLGPYGGSTCKTLAPPGG